MSIFIFNIEKTTHIPSQMVLAEISFIKAGRPIPFETQIDVTASQYLDENYYNSKFLAIYTDKIVPYFLFDGLIDIPIYPDVVVFIPYEAKESLSVAGFKYDMGLDNIITINDRYLYDKSWNDERDFLETLVHELIHVQAYGFLGESEKIFEAKTQAASTEILASMCNMQDEIACKTFWLYMYKYQKTYVKIKLENLHIEWIYPIWSRLFFWNINQLAQFDKMTRYNLQDVDQYKNNIQAYLLNPYTNYLIPAVFGIRLDTEKPKINCNNNINCMGIPNETILMDFDDTRYLLGSLKWLLPPAYNYQ